jgi:hypothetical protein
VATRESSNQNGATGDTPEPIVGECGASILGPRNVPVEPASLSLDDATMAARSKSKPITVR